MREDALKWFRGLGYFPTLKKARVWVGSLEKETEQRLERFCDQQQRKTTQEINKLERTRA